MVIMKYSRRCSDNDKGWIRKLDTSDSVVDSKVSKHFESHQLFYRRSKLGSMCENKCGKS